MGDTEPTEPQCEVVDKLIALARNAHRNVDTADPIDYWYRLGQRNAYAEAAGLTLAGGVDDLAFTIADRITLALSAGCADLAELRLRALCLETDIVVTIDGAGTGLEWLGPQAFARRYGDRPGVDHDFGTRWGVRGDQRVSLRLEPAATTGLLHAYDATWDEYAVLGDRVPEPAVRTAFDETLGGPTTPTIEQFAALVRSRAADLAPAALPAAALVASTAAGPAAWVEPVVSCGPGL